MEKVENKILLFFLLVSTLIQLSCQKESQPLQPLDYLDYFDNPDNGFNKKVVTTDYTYEIQVKTPEYVALKEDVNLKQPSLIKKRIKSLDATVWFNVKLFTSKENINPLKNKISGLEEYNQRLNFFLTEAQKNFNLLYGGQEQKQVAYFFENSYGVTPFETMIVGYQLSDNKYNKDLELSYQDNLFNNGIIKISITGKDFSNKPTLIL